MLSRSAALACHSLAQLGPSPLVQKLYTCRTRTLKHLLPLRQAQHVKVPFQGVTRAMSTSATPVRDSIREKVEASLHPLSLDIVDESSKHAGHAAMKGLPAGETHFRVSIVSPEFEGLTTIKRHKLVYKTLAEELAGPVHALSLKTKAPSEAQ